MRQYKIARDNELLIDLDSGNLTGFHKILGVIKGTRKVTVLSVVEVESKTPGHFHVTVTLKESLPELERILLQACLGSDPKREVLSWSRSRNKDTSPVLFIEPYEISDEDYDDMERRPHSDEDETLPCDHDVSDGRCFHMNVFQQSNPLVNYGVS